MPVKLTGMGLLLGVLVIALGGCSSAVSEQTRRTHLNKWCLSAPTEVIDCAYETFDQCQASRAGVGGQCYVNPRLTEAAPISRQRQGR